MMEYLERRAPLINVFMSLGRMTGRKCPAGDIEIDIATPCGYVKVFKGFNR